MTDCIVQDSASPSAEPYSFAAELADSLLGTQQAPSEADSFSNAEYRELGEALASILSTSSSSSLSPPPTAEPGSPTPPRRSSAELSPSAARRLLSSSEIETRSLSPSSDQDLAEEPQSPLGKSSLAAVASDSEEEASGSPKKPIKLPQRKGGMQLWQFLYALLSDPQYKDLIEWTANVKEREFRLHEPEAIAIWWGDHKNKRNMSYDKLSRSLRYYYDKGIIRKINGQRYVYRFCVAPEVMYRHIGNSDCRPRLKPMSLAAQNALSTTSKFQTMLYPHQLPPHALPHTMFNPHSVPMQCPHHHTSAAYPHLLQSHTFLQPPPACSSSQPEFSSYLQPNGQGFTHKPAMFQPHLLSPVKHVTQSPFADFYPSDEGIFPSFMSDGSPSPQPFSPASLPSSLAPQTSPLSSSSPPPPYGWNVPLSSTL